MTVTQWSVGLVCVKYHPRGERARSLKDKRYFSRAIRPSSLGPRTLSISQGKFFSTPPPRIFRHVPLLIFDSSVPSLDLSLQHCVPSGQMTVIRVLILGHSFIRRLREYVRRSTDLDANLHSRECIELKWHGVGERTVLTTVQFDLSVVKSFKPDIVILQVSTNDLSHLSPVNVGSAIEDLTRSLHDSLNVKCVCLSSYLSNRGSYVQQERDPLKSVF